MDEKLNKAPEISDKARLHSFSLADFRQSVDSMIATSDTSYRSMYDINRVRRVRDYDEQRVKQIIETGTIQAQQELSYNYFAIDGFYRRIIIYYATFLKYLGVLVPNVSYGDKMKNKAIQKRYYKAMDFVERMNVPTLSTSFMTKALINGCYYGIIQTLDKENFVILDLPARFCYTRYKDIYNNDVIEFDLRYFDTLTEGEIRNRALAVYPKEIALAYNRFHKGKGPQYYLVPSEIGVCFPMFDGRPAFLSTIPEIINYRDYETMEKKKDANEVKKILIQKIPHLTDGTLLFEPVEAEEMHRGSVEMLKKNEDVSVLTTYGDVTLEGSGTVNESVSKNNLEKIAQSVYRSAGVSAQLFAATGNMALTSSIQNDLAFVMATAQKFARFYSNIVNRLFGNGQINFKYTLLPISFYNEKEFLDSSVKGATSGYSFLLPAIAMGLSQRDLVGIKTLENDVLKLQDLLVPLKTSYTESSSGEGAGRPSLPDTEKSDKTIKNIEAGGGSSSSKEDKGE